jgi:hypothetical protein
MSNLQTNLQRKIHGTDATASVDSYHRCENLFAYEVPRLPGGHDSQSMKFQNLITLVNSVNCRSGALYYKAVVWYRQVYMLDSR